MRSDVEQSNGLENQGYMSEEREPDVISSERALLGQAVMFVDIPVRGMLATDVQCRIRISVH